DGIRGRNVTGVQTCALPISGRPRRLLLPAPGRPRARRPGRPGPARWRLAAYLALVAVVLPRGLLLPAGLADAPHRGRQPRRRPRSEERRVGRDWRVERGRTH